MAAKTPKNARKRKIGRPFEPGNPGGPGRPVSRPIAAMLKAMGEDADGKQYKALAKKIWEQAVAKGDYKFARELLDRIDGKCVERQELSGELTIHRQRFADRVQALGDEE